MPDRKLKVPSIPSTTQRRPFVVRALVPSSPSSPSSGRPALRRLTTASSAAVSARLTRSAGERLVAMSRPPSRAAASAARAPARTARAARSRSAVIAALGRGRNRRTAWAGRRAAVGRGPPAGRLDVDPLERRAVVGDPGALHAEERAVRERQPRADVWMQRAHHARLLLRRGSRVERALGGGDLLGVGGPRVLLLDARRALVERPHEQVRAESLQARRE